MPCIGVNFPMEAPIVKRWTYGKKYMSMNQKSTIVITIVINDNLIVCPSIRLFLLSSGFAGLVVRLFKNNRAWRFQVEIDTV